MRYFTLLVLLVFPAVAYSQDPSRCTVLSSDKERLECYDLVFRKAPLVSNSSKWRVIEEKSKLDDSREVRLSVLSAEPVRGRFGETKNPILVLNCRERTTDLYIVFGDHFMSSLNGGGRVNTRVDRQPAKTFSMVESNDHKALGLWSGSSAIPFIKSLFGGSSLYVRATPYNESSLEMDFPIGGLEEAIKPLREACNW